MAIPLVMTGPGGNYQSRYEADGLNIVKKTQPTREQPDERDPSSQYGTASYVRYRKRREQREQPKRQPAMLARKDTVEISPAISMVLNANEVTQIQPETSQGHWSKAGVLAAAAAAIESWLAIQQQALLQVSENVLSLQRPEAPSIAPPREPALPTGGITLKPLPVSDEDHLESPHDVRKRRMEQVKQTTELEFSHDIKTHAETEADSPVHQGLAIDPRLFPDFTGNGRRAGNQQGHGVRARQRAGTQRRYSKGSEQGTLFGANR